MTLVYCTNRIIIAFVCSSSRLTVMTLAEFQQFAGWLSIVGCIMDDIVVVCDNRVLHPLRKNKNIEGICIPLVISILKVPIKEHQKSLHYERL